MKRFIVILFVLISSTTYGQQVGKFQTTEVSFQFKKDGVWQDWSKWEKVSSLVYVDSKQGKFTIYTTEPQYYDIIRNEGKSIENGNNIYSFFCTNENGVNCRLQILDNATEYIQLYITYNDVVIAYNLRKII